MLQHNATAIAPGRAHLAHATMIALHGLCCGLPILALLATAATGASAGVLAFSAFATTLHGFVHGHEIWIMAASAVLVTLGAGLELAARVDGGPRRFPWLFALSVACFAFNLALVAAHRLT